MTVSRGSVEPRSTYHWRRLEDLATSPIFVPSSAGKAGRDEWTGENPGGEEGYVVVSIVSDDGFRLECFDAADVGRGPVAVLRAANGERVGNLLHSCWLPEARPAPSVERLNFGDDLTEERLANLSSDKRARVEEIVRDFDR